MSGQTDRKLEDLAKWYYYHKPIVVEQRLDLMKRVEFLEKTVENLMLLTTYLVEDIQKLERRDRLWTPGGVQVNGDLTRFG